MAISEQILLTAKNQASQAFKELAADAKKATDGMAEGAKKTTPAFSGLAESLGANIAKTAAFGILGVTVGGALRAIGEAAKFALDQAGEAEVVNARLEAVLRATGYTAGLTGEELDNMAGDLSKMSGVEDDVIKNSEAVLLTFARIGKQVFPEAMTAAMNMSAVMGGDLQGSILQVGKALNDPLEGLTALRRVGVAFTNDQEMAIKAMVESGDTMGAQKLILAELTFEFGRAAEEIGNTYVASQNKAKNAVANLAEEVASPYLPLLKEHNLVVADSVGALTDLVVHYNMASTGVDHARIVFEGGKAALVDNTEAIQGNDLALHALDRAAVEASLSQLHLGEGTAALSELMTSATTATQGLGMSESELAEGALNLKTVMAGELGREMDNYKERMRGLGSQSAELLNKIAALEKRSWLSSRQKAELAELKGELAGVEGEIRSVTNAHDEQTARIIFNMAQQQLALSGLDATAQLEALQEMANRMGLVDTQTEQANVAMAEVFSHVTSANAGNVAEAVSAIGFAMKYGLDMTVYMGRALDALDGKTVDINVITHYSSTGRPNEYNLGAKGGGRAAGGPVATGTPYWVGESGPEPFVPAMPGYVLSRQDAMAAVAGSGKGGPVVNNNISIVNHNESAAAAAIAWQQIDRMRETSLAQSMGG